MPRTPVSRLDYAREAYDKAFRELVNQMRGRMKKRPDAATEAMENEIKWLPESLEFWAQQNPEWTRQDFENSPWGQYAIIDWIDPKNKARLWADAQSILNREEKEMMASWKRSA